MPSAIEAENRTFQKTVPGLPLGLGRDEAIDRGTPNNWSELASLSWVPLDPPTQ